MKFFKGLTLRTKLTGFSILMILLQGVSQVINMEQMSTALADKIKSVMAVDARSLGNAIGSQFSTLYKNTLAFSHDPNVQTMEPTKVSGTLEHMVEQYKDYDLVLVVDKNGKFVAANNKDSGGTAVKTDDLKKTSFADSTWFKNVMEKQFTEDSDKGYRGVYFEDFMADPISKVAFGDDRLGSSFSAPIIENSVVVGVVTARVGSRWIEKHCLEAFELFKLRGIDSAEIIVANKEGLYIVDHDPAVRSKGENKIAHDADLLMKYKSPTDAGKRVVAGESGAMIEFSNRKNEEQVVGYHHIDNENWIKSIGWSVVVRSGTQESFKALATTHHTFYILFGLTVVVSLILSGFFSRALANSIEVITSTLAKNSDDVTTAGEKIASTATELSDSAREQATALQQTVAAVDEISSMVEKNSDAATRSKEVSNRSRETAEKGKNTVTLMLKAIDDIDKSTNEISTQMAASNHELSDITKMIHEIGTKTKVINEIVFQTKLLSFNASVEAARAGEYGKGFAVVAEEVGNLAQMSGSAAKEITGMLESSVSKVEAIVKNTKSKVDSLMHDSHEKVRAGAETAHECHKVLEEIIENVKSVDALVSDIETASNEQSLGVREISNAVGQLERLSQKTSLVAQGSSVSAEEVRGQARTLKDLVSNLGHIIRGAKGGTHVTTPHVHESHSINRMTIANNKESSKSKRVAAMPLKVQAPQKIAAPVKMASGGDHVPSADDPGFQE